MIKYIFIDIRILIETQTLYDLKMPKNLPFILKNILKIIVFDIK